MNRLEIDICYEKKKLNIQYCEDINGVLFITGPSGSGKTSLLRCIAGLDNPDSGKILWNGNVWFDSSKNLNLPTQKRNIALVRQGDNLFSHLSVEENILYGYSRSNDQSKFSVEEIIETFQLKKFLNRRPQTLSGGEKQRVAMARAILSSPELLILDEPMSALDYWSKESLFKFFKIIKERMRIPILFVSHTENEYKKIADKFIFLKNGSVCSYGDALLDRNPFG